MPTITLPLIPAAPTYAYPKEVDRAPHLTYFPIEAILTRAWTTDAHTTAYSVPHLPYRLSRDAVQLGGGVRMVVFIADVDCEQSHAASGGQGDVPASDEWWLQELVKLDALRHAFPGAFIYRTRGGYRIIYLLLCSDVLCSQDDAQRWSTNYLAWVVALRRRFEIYADPACHDWQRLYRCPHATRTPGGRPEARETIGSPYQIGVWTCEPTPEEHALAKTLAKRPVPPQRREHTATSVHAGDGVFFYAFQARGWIGTTLAPGKWSIRCPWEDQHSKGVTFNTSTILFAPGAGDLFGWLHCSHSHCQTRDIRDVLRVFTEDELTRAKREAGVVTPAAEEKPLRRLYQPYFGLRVKGVRYAS
jgi:hypothetical protein